MEVEFEFEWHEEKNSANKLKHKIGFETAVLIWEGFVLEWEDVRFDYGEKRISVIGEINGRAIFVAYTPRENRRRIITARKAREDEQRKYREALARRLEAGDDG